MAEDYNTIPLVPKSDEDPDYVEDYMKPPKPIKKKMARLKPKKRMHGGYLGQKGGYKKMLDEADDY